MNIIVIGQGRHGKDTFCEIAETHGLSFESSSHLACNIFIFEALKEKYGYKTAEECFEDRHNHRAEWFDLITEYNKEDKARLAKQIFRENSIYCGMRCPKELQACKDQGITDLIIYIDASERLGDTEGKDSNNITKSDADVIIENNGTYQEFKDKVDRIVHFLMWG